MMIMGLGRYAQLPDCAFSHLFVYFCTLIFEIGFDFIALVSNLEQSCPCLPPNPAALWFLIEVSSISVYKSYCLGKFLS